MMHHNKPLQEKMERLCVIWQKILRLQDWDITVSVDPHNDIGAYGDVEAFNPKRIAHIRIADPETLPNDSFMLIDPERTLVHELLHVHLSSLKSRQTLAEEQAIHTLASALVSLRRRN